MAGADRKGCEGNEGRLVCFTATGRSFSNSAQRDEAQPDQSGLNLRPQFSSSARGIYLYIAKLQVQNQRRARSCWRPRREYTLLGFLV